VSIDYALRCEWFCHCLLCEGCACQSWVCFWTGYLRWTSTGHLAHVPVYMLRKMPKIGFYIGSTFLNQIYNRKICSCFRYMNSWDNTSVSLCLTWLYCHYMHASDNRKFWKCRQLSPRSCVVSICQNSVNRNQVISSWSASEFEAAVVNLVHSNDEWIKQWEVCSKFKVSNVATISTHSIYTFWRMQTCFKTTHKSKFFVQQFP
jgi:hypothetical protein